MAFIRSTRLGAHFTAQLHRLQKASHLSLTPTPHAFLLRLPFPTSHLFFFACTFPGLLSGPGRGVEGRGCRGICSLCDCPAPPLLRNPGRCWVGGFWPCRTNTPLHKTRHPIFWGPSTTDEVYHPSQFSYRYLLPCPCTFRSKRLGEAPLVSQRQGPNLNLSDAGIGRGEGVGHPQSRISPVEKIPMRATSLF